MKRRGDPAPLAVLRYWHGMTEAEWKHYQAKADRGESLNAIEQVEAACIVERVKAWEREQGHVHEV